jgi:hypothetical protein
LLGRIQRLSISGVVYRHPELMGDCMIGETVLHFAERHVVEGAERVAKQQARIGKMVERGMNHPEIIKMARSSLATLKDSQRLAIDHLNMERKKARLPPLEAGRGIDPLSR